MYTNSPSFTRIILCCSSLLLSGYAHANTLEWQPLDPTADPAKWDATTVNWQTAGQPVPWTAGADALFASAPTAVDIDGSIVAGQLTTNDAFRFFIDNSSDQLRVTGLSGSPTLWFSGNVGANADSYPDVAAQLQRGVVMEPGTVTELSATIQSRLGGSPFVSVRGDNSVVRFSGRWIADTGSIYSWLMPVEGGRFVITEDARFQFIKEAFYTLQLWVHGDGSGTLELEEGFVADRTELARQPLGIGAMRISNTTFISHHSQNLPLGYRPNTSDAVQANGHLVFENEVGGRWIVRSNDQTYPGAVWIWRSMEVSTERDLIHSGVTESASDYTALNGWSVFGGVVTKTGPAALILAGEQSYRDGSQFHVQEGTLDLVTNPSAGRHRDGSTYSGTLQLRVADAAAARLQSASQLASIESAGKVELLAPVSLHGIDGLWLEDSSKLVINLNNDASEAAIRVDYNAILNGQLILRASEGFAPQVDARFPILQAAILNGAVFGEWELVDLTGAGMVLETEGTTIYARATRAAGRPAGEVLLSDAFDDLSQWQDLSTVPRWGTTLTNRSAFTINDGQLSLIRSGADDTTNYTAYNTSNGLKTFTAVDFQFAEAIDRSSTALIVDIRLRWQATTSSSGEGGRFIIAFNHAYPDGGLDLTPEGQQGSRIADFSEPWWARPAYHLRMRNGTTGAGSSMLQYGGGRSFLGEYEATQNWWLAGFISGAGGVAPGNGDDFPANSWTRTASGLASDTFTWYRYALYPDRQEVWRDENANGLFDPDELAAVMPLPQSSDAPLYNYIDRIEGLRLFWNGRDSDGNGTGQVYVDELHLIQQSDQPPQAVAQLPNSVLITNGTDVALRLDGSASVDPEGQPLHYQWLVNGTVVAAGAHPASATRLPVGSHQITLIVTDAAGNQSRTQHTVIASQGNLRPTARAGADINLIANDRLLAAAQLDASASFDQDGSIVSYEWFNLATGERLHLSSSPAFSTVLPVGLHSFELRVTDNEGATGTDSIRVMVRSVSSAEEFVLYRENFSRPHDGTEKGPWEVHWNLMRFDGDPVASIRYDGNAHRSLASGFSSEINLAKVNANRDGDEYDVTNARGHMWMNQMPYQNASPGEWLLWTDEFNIPTSAYDITRIQFHATDSSPERVKVAFAARIEDQWYIYWDGRVETQWNAWRLYSIEFATSGWYRFEPGPAFSINRAEPASLPSGNIDAFGLYMLKDYAWYVNRIDNVTIYVRERVPAPPFLLWQLAHFSGEELLDDSLETTLWGSEADPSTSGISNLARFAFGMDPWQTDMPVAIIPADPQPVLQFAIATAAADAVDVSVHISEDLQNWAPLAQPPQMVESSDARLLYEVNLPQQPATFSRLIIRPAN